MPSKEDKLWTNQSKSYKIKYFGALGELFKRIDKDAEVDTLPRTDSDNAQEKHKEA